jgi:fatty acid desaturase
MAFLGPLAALLGIEVDTLVERLKRNATTIAVVAFLALIGVVFLLVAANVALTGWVGPLFAPLILGGAAIVVAAIVWFVADAGEKRRARHAADRRRSTDTTALITTAALTALPLAFKNPTLRLLALPASAVLGYMLLGRRRAEDDKAG